MSDLGLSGLASGVDTSSIIDKLMELERAKSTRITLRQSAVQAHQSDLQAIATKMNALRDAASALTLSDAYKQSQSVASSDASHVSATLISGAGIGGHTVQVDRLASSAQHGYTWTPPTSARTMDLGGGVTIQVAANATAADVATSINATPNASVYAAVVGDATATPPTQRLVLSARTTGSASDFAISDPGLAEDAAYARTGSQLDASYRLDGESTARTSTSNTVEDALPGVRLMLKGVTSTPATVTVTPATVDKDALKAKITTFVNAYNDVVELTRSDLAEKRVANASTATDAAKGQLFGDLGLTSMLSQLRDQMQATVSGLSGVKSLADIGIGMAKASGGASSADALSGKLTIDDAALSDALDKDWTQVRDLFAGKGAAKGIGTQIWSYARSQSGTGGVLDSRIASDTSSLGDLADQLTRMNAHISDEQSRLKAQFAAMETAMANAQSQQSWLSGQISALG